MRDQLFVALLVVFLPWNKIREEHRCIFLNLRHFVAILFHLDLEGLCSNLNDSSIHSRVSLGSGSAT